MKIYELVEMDMDGNIVREESFDYEGELALCGGSGGGGTSSTTTEPPTWMKETMPWVAQQARGLVQSTPLQMYPYETTAGFTGAQRKAQEMATTRALGGNPLLGQAQKYYGDVIGGKYLDINQNPALQNLLQKGVETTTPQIDTSAQTAGRYGSGSYGALKGNALGSLLANIYNPERAIQQTTAQGAPQMAQADYYDIGQLANVGAEQQKMNQATIDEAISRWEFPQLEPYQRLGMLTNLLQGNYGGTTITNTSGGGK